MHRYYHGQHYQNYVQGDTARNLNNNVTQSSRQKTVIMNGGQGNYHAHHYNSPLEKIDNINKHHHYQANYGYDLHHDASDLEDFSSPPTTNSHRREDRERRETDFVPSFVLIDACKTNDERKVREICKKLSTLPTETAQAVANFQDQAGRTPLSHACGGGSISVIEELIRLLCIDPNLPDNDGNTALHHASQAGHSEAVDLLIARFGDDLDLNCRNATGLTPLMKAALQGRTRCVKSLLSAGACSTLRDYSRSLTATEWARLCGRHICAEVITRCAKDANRHYSSSSSMNFPLDSSSNLPMSRSNMELKRVNSDESPYYHLYARSTVSGASWLKNKIRNSLGNKRPPISEGSYTLMGGATICAGSLLLPAIKPLIEQQRAKHAMANKKLTIPTVQVTSVKR